jgi:hypothetical protein
MPAASLGATFRAFGAYQQASADKSALQSQAQAFTWDQAIRKQQALEQQQTGAAESTQSGLKYASLYGQQRAAMASNGVQLDSGSAAAVAASTKLVSSIDAATIQNNANRESWNYQAAATNFGNQAAFKSAGADSITPITSAATSLITDANKVSATWGTPNPAPVPISINGQGLAGAYSNPYVSGQVVNNPSAWNTTMLD